ncbi:hypothetical protein C8Q70DRAFT_540024 [Cubamyces menziesii]|nr:hypothetical protein C8Q70DRAFT_540024 [Cubamyces menziesii]
MLVTVAETPSCPTTHKLRIQFHGSPGLLFRANDQCKWKPSIRTVSVRLGSNPFRYVREYRLELDGPEMSHSEYQAWETTVLFSVWPTITIFIFGSC